MFSAPSRSVSEHRSSGVSQVLLCLLLAASGALLGLIGAFLVPLEIRGTAIGVADLVALVGNLALGRFAAAATGNRLGPLAAFAGWIVIAVLAGVRRGPADDPTLVIWGSIPGIGGAAAVGLLYYGLGAVAGAVAIGWGRGRDRRAGNRYPRNRTSLGLGRR